MKDFNFFAPYSKSRKGFKKEYYVVVALFTTLILFVTFTFAFNYFNISKLKTETADIQKQLNSKETIEKLKEAEAEEKKLALMNQYNNIVTKISANINAKDFLGSKVIDKINFCVPEGVYFKVLEMNSGEVRLEAEAKNREAIAIFERALKELDIVKEVHVSTINWETSGSKTPTFTVNCILKDGDNHESN